MSRSDSTRETAANAADLFSAALASQLSREATSGVQRTAAAAAPDDDEEPVSSPGMTLRQLVLRGGPLAPERAVRIVARAARVMAEAHSAGTVHGELTPDDIVIMSLAGEHDYVQLPELGADREPGYEPEPEFATPEAAGGLSCDQRSDIYSLGALLFFALTGRPPYQGDARELLRCQLFAPPPSVAGSSPHRVSRLLDALVRRCMMKNPAARPESADDLAATLLAIPATEPGGLTDADASTRVRRARLWGRGWPIVQPRRAIQIDTGHMGPGRGFDEPTVETAPPSISGSRLVEFAVGGMRTERATLPPPPVQIATLPPPSSVPRRLVGTPCLATLPSPPFPGYEVRSFSRKANGSKPPSAR
jgi:serine/threonine protein kinase